jgi:hypothetical protein
MYVLSVWSVLSVVVLYSELLRVMGIAVCAVC